MRQVLQTAVPIVAAVVASGGAVDLGTVGLALVGAVAVTGVKFVLLAAAEIPVAGPGTPFGWRAADRAIPAFVGVVAGVWPSDVAGFVAVDWRAAAVAASAASVLALVQMLLLDTTGDGRHASR